jgi:hypothetical protein
MASKKTHSTHQLRRSKVKREKRKRPRPMSLDEAKLRKQIEQGSQPVVVED